jgi:hypothetical protein
MTASNPEAIAIIEKMIGDHKLDISLTESLLAGELYVLERRIAEVREGLEQGLNIDSNWLREGAHKAEEAISKRRNLYTSLRTLENVVLPAAGGSKK